MKVLLLLMRADHTWLENGQASIRVSKHQLALLVGVPPEEADVREERVRLLVDGDPGVGAAVDPDVERASLGHEGHPIGRVPAPADRGGDAWGTRGQ